MSELYLMVTICSRKNMSKFVGFYEKNQVEVADVSFGRGTASSAVLDYFGLEDDEKGVHFAVVTDDTWKNIKKGLQSELRIDVPGTGIAFTIPLSSVGGKQALGLLVDGQNFEKGEESTLKETNHELIVAIANYGYNTQVMKAAEEGGATGGTVLHGKGVGMKRAEQFLGVSLVTEKELILIVTKTSQKNAIMSAIMEKAGINTKAGAIVLSLPVTSTAGLRIIEDDEEEK
jgi:nitrogen regulatory protein PII